MHFSLTNLRQLQLPRLTGLEATLLELWQNWLGLPLVESAAGGAGQSAAAAAAMAELDASRAVPLTRLEPLDVEAVAADATALKISLSDGIMQRRKSEIRRRRSKEVQPSKASPSQGGALEPESPMTDPPSGAAKGAKEVNSATTSEVMPPLPKKKKKKKMSKAGAGAQGDL